MNKEFWIQMKHVLAISALLAAGLIPVAQAQAPAATSAAAAPNTKIAVIAFQAAVAKTNEGQKNFADLGRS